jgi:ferric-dicitrate binding protein FerR (iron transport regulator)
MDDARRLAYLFRRYYEKACTPVEKDELFSLLLRAEQDEVLRRMIDETWNYELPSYPHEDERAEAILDYIIHLRPPASFPAMVPPEARDPSNWLRQAVPVFRYARYAAVLLLVVMAGILLYYYNRPRPSPIPPFAAAKILPAATDSCLTLSDGSKVLLHKDARIEYQGGFSGETREVTLHGEAYFDIRPDHRPFIVHTGTIRTIVLGTAFNINAHDGRMITITVTKGKVKVENGAGEFSILRRNEQLSVDSLHTRLKKIQVDAAEILAWKKPYLLFNDVTMKEAMQELEQRFHVSISLASPALGNCSVTATFIREEPLEQIINVLSKINNMEYKIISPTNIALSGEGCK